MWLNYPNMPTGTDACEEIFDSLIQWAKSRNILLVNDNPYSFVLTAKPKSILSRPGAKEVAIELNSLSKSFNMSGWRVGMLLGKEEVLKETLKVKSNMDSGMYYGTQQAAITALKMNNDWFIKLNKEYEKRRELMQEFIKKINAYYTPGQVGLFLWARLPDGFSSDKIFTDNLLNEKNIFITPGFIFGSEGKGYIRCSLCVPEASIEKAIKRMDL